MTHWVGVELANDHDFRALRKGFTAERKVFPGNRSRIARPFQGFLSLSPGRYVELSRVSPDEMHTRELFLRHHRAETNRAGVSNRLGVSFAFLRLSAS